MVQFWAKNSAVHVLGVGDFNFDLDAPIGAGVQLQDVENGETCYFYEDTGGESVPSGDWSYRINLGKGTGGGSDPTCDVTLAIIDSGGSIVETIVGPDNHTANANAGAIFTGSSIGEGAKTIEATERVALIVDNVVAGARQLEVRFDGAFDDDTDIIRPQTSSGYGNKVQGVESANIGKVQGVESANIGKVQGS